MRNSWASIDLGVHEGGGGEGGEKEICERKATQNWASLNQFEAMISTLKYQNTHTYMYMQIDRALLSYPGPPDIVRTIYLLIIYLQANMASTVVFAM